MKSGLFVGVNNKILGVLFCFCGGIGLSGCIGKSLLMRVSWHSSGAGSLDGGVSGGSCLGGASSQYYDNNAKHGLGMVFWALMPVLLSGNGNLFFPMMCSMSEVVYYRWNQQSLPMLALTIPIGICSGDNGDVLGWTLSAGTTDLYVGLFLNGTSSLITAFNLVVTYLASGAGGSCAGKDGGGVLFIDCYMAICALYIISLPALNLAVADSVAEEAYSAGLCDRDTFGHLFWIFGHPEVYVLILPAWGTWNINSRNVCGQGVLVTSLIGIFVLALIVWGHHLFTTSMELDSRVMFGVCSLVIALPTGTKLYSWLWQHNKR